MFATGGAWGAGDDAYRVVVRHASDAILLSDPATMRILDVNPALCALVGRAEEELVGLPLGDLIVAPDSEIHANADRLARTGRAFLGVRRVRHRDGTVIDVESNASEIHVGERRVIVAVWRDLRERIRSEQALRETEQKFRQADRALRESEERFRRLSEAAYEGIAVTEKGRFVDGNQQLADMLHCQLSDLVGRPAADFVAPESRAEVAARQMSGDERLYEHVALRADGATFVVEARARTIRVDDRPLRITVLRDVTERRALEAHLRETEKMQAVGRLAAGVAHDFNNLLTVILACSDLLSGSMLEPGEGPGLAREISEAAARGAVLTRQLLMFSRKQVAAVRALDVNDLVTSFVKLLSRVIGEDIEIMTELADRLPPVLADAGQLEQVLMNLSTNARDAMPRGGELRIRTELLDGGADAAPGSPGPGWVRISVMDGGSGMTPEVLARACEPFFTTKEVGRGTGLGLSTVKSILGELGGRVVFESADGRGTVAQVWLPAATKASVPAAKVVEEGLPRGQETVLLVDDDPGVRALVHTVLTRQGYDVVSTGPADVERSMREHRRPIDLILTDVVMPLTSGPEVDRLVRRAFPSARTLFMSGYVDQALAITAGEVRLLEKPFTPALLARAVREVLDG
jgi:two-component system cell cycle sensor histidine kinase/response regulator CckA